MLKTFMLSMRLLWRDWRARQWYVVFIALVVAVSTTSAVDLYTQRLMGGLISQSAKLLGGDLVVKSDTPLPSAWEQYAKSLKLDAAQILVYPSMINANGKLHLVNLQAIESGYPLVPAPPLATIAVDARLLTQLQIKLHDKVNVGAAQFKVTQTLSAENSLMTGWLIAPRVLINLADVPATQTVVPGSRLEYRLLITGDKAAVENYKQWITPQLTGNRTLTTVNHQQLFLSHILANTQHFINLLVLICIVMSSIAIALSIHQFLRKHFNDVALWRTLGARKRQITLIFFWQLLAIALLSGAVGITLAFLMQYVLSEILASILPFSLASVAIHHSYVGFVMSAFLLFAFAYPLVSELPQTSPLFIWREEIKKSQRSRFYFITAISIFILGVLWLMNFSMLSLFFINAILLSIGFMYALSLMLLKCLKILIPFTQGAVRRGIAQLIQHPDSVGMQMTAFTLIFSCVGILIIIGNHVVADWFTSLPPQSPNYFLMNIASDDIPALKHYLRGFGANKISLYPIVRGRLIALNDLPILQAVPTESQTHNTLHRELNLTWLQNYPADNNIVQGEDFLKQTSAKPLVSVEQDMAKALHFKIGDKLTFRISDKEISAYIANIRSVQWSALHPNFYIIFNTGVLNNFPLTYLSSLYLTENQAKLMDDLTLKFPNITVIDIAEALQQIQQIISKMSLAIEFLLAFSVLTAILIFITSLQATMDQRVKTYQLLRILGASKNFLRRSLSMEFLVLSLLIGLSTLLLIKIIVYLLSQYLLRI